MTAPPDQPILTRVQATILLADAARAHGDGTFSLLRGGIDRVQSDATEEIPLRAAVVVRLVGEPADAGQHMFRIRLVASGGEEILHSPPQTVQIPESGGNHVIVAEFGVKFPGLGRYAFELRIDDRVLATWPMEVVRRAPAGAA